MQVAVMSREFLTDFIKIYEYEPCLWHINSKEYHDRNKKEAAYAKLIEKLKEVDANATRDSVVKKINNLRSAFRKEKKKIKNSWKSGASADNVYKPKLWYFSLLSFLNDQDIPRTSRSNMENDYDGADDENTSDTDVQEETAQQDGPTQNSGEHLSNQSLASTSTFTPSTPLKHLRKKTSNETETQDLAKDVLVQVNEHFKRFRTDEDRFDVISKGFAIKLRGLPQQQMLLAEKLMNETLFQAEMGCLTVSHKLVGE